MQGTQKETNETNIQQMMEYVKQSGMSPKSLFYAKAHQMGVDPNKIIQQLQHR